MSWHFSQALVEEYSEASSWDGEQSVPSKSTTTAGESSCNDNVTEYLGPSLSGTMFDPLMGDLGEGLLTWFRAGFRARISLSESKGPRGLQENDRDSGKKWHESLAKYDPDSCSWKTLPLSRQEGLTEFSETWPASGTMLNGHVWECATSEVITTGSGSGFWPTPLASDAIMYRKNWQSMANQDGQRRANGQWRTQRVGYRYAARFGMNASSMLWDWLMAMPLGWTRSEPLAMHKFRQWQRAHVKFYTDG